MAKKKPASLPIPITPDGSLHEIPIQYLHLDSGNPRFGGTSHSTDETILVDEIVGQHGVDDVLSSIACNGFFQAEPLVGAINKEHGNEITVVEGNRRLTACLILLNDERAKNQDRLRSRFPNPAIKKNELPVAIYDWGKEEDRKLLLPYLGVRHIVGGAQWDSFAKAAWIADMLAKNLIPAGLVKSMIGDDQGFTDRIIEGYYFVEQIKKTNAYDVSQSLRRGRGSLQEFPFSWVYTALGYRNVRQFLLLPASGAVSPNPISEEALPKAGQLMQFMFGGNGKPAAISDSRELGDLAKAVGDEKAIDILDGGGTIEDALDAVQPSEQRLLALLMRIAKPLSSAVDLASSMSPVDKATWGELEEKTGDIANRAENLYNIVDQQLRPGRAGRGNK